MKFKKNWTERGTRVPKAPPRVVDQALRTRLLFRKFHMFRKCAA